MTDRPPVVSVRTPKGSSAAKSYIVDVVFGEMLGIPYSQDEWGGSNYKICVGERSVDLPDIVLSRLGLGMPSAETNPELPLDNWPLPQLDEGRLHRIAPLPVLFGTPELRIEDDSIYCGVDVFGTLFFMLTRCEEVTLPDRDVHDRFPASASLALRAGFLDRPIVDEYVDVLWVLVKHLSPQLRRKRRQGRVRPSCDVDQPFDCDVSCGRRFVRTLAGDIVKRRDLRAARRRIRGFLCHRKGDHHLDANYTFDWYMDVCEQHGQKAAFYFIPDHSAGAIDGCYSLSDKAILRLVQKIAGRGHEIGVHGSYNTYRDGGRIVNERKRMAAACRKSGVAAEIRGNRQHYLRWDSMQTPDHLDAAGYEYDTTGGFADAPGFRFGTSRPFTMWSWRSKAPLKLRQRPLVLMERTLLSPQYMNMECSGDSLELALVLKERAMEFGGDFTFLWHNSSLRTPRDRTFFEELVR